MSTLCEECGVKRCSECRKAVQRQKCREYKAAHRAEIAAYNAKYKAENRAAISAYNSKYNLENRATIQPRQSARRAERTKTDPAFKLSQVMRSRIRRMLKDRSNGPRFKKLLGCTIDVALIWLESQFTGEMTLDNHGSVWHLDHVIPCSKFDLTDPEEATKCFHWSNLQPLLALENLKKNRSTTVEEQITHQDKIDKFLEKYNFSTEEATRVVFDRTAYVSK